MYLTERPSAAAATTPPDDRRPVRGRRSLAALPSTVLVLGTVSLITDVSSEMITAVLPLYLVAELGLSPLGFGVLDGVYNGVSALVRLVGGRLSDRGEGGGHKTVAAVGYGLSALCKPLLLMVHSLPWIGAVLAVDRTGKGLRTAPRDAMISLAAEPAARGRAFGVHRAMDTAGALCGPLVAFLLLRAAADGYDAVFTVSFCIAVLGVVVLLLFVPGRARNAARPTAERAPAQPRMPVRALLARPEVRRLTGCAVLLGLTTISDSFLYLTLQRRLDLPAGWFPLLPLGTAAAFLLLAVPLGAIADRLGRRRLFLAGHLALLGAYGLLVAPLAGGPLLVCAVLVLHGSFYAATDGVLAAATADAVPEEVRGSGLALVQTGQTAARFVCSLAFGAAWTAWGDRTAVLAAALGLALAASLSARLLRRAAPA
ncbi:sugar phosphate permease [Streptomyces sp. 2333.5]|uniref:MFS transporter n=1 Tax=unclassified Streptomyces TaxID=2593676 RepID=UPI00089D5715|nr:MULTISPECIES: MFS transporter [unclassified Streptomyces]PJJ06187.1 sugar phosphate permease [Streptomyces sp. 2333.5]SEE91843.1 Sugar phosphate permease [Streptomyces sp. 2314.4]SEF07667.1 Sugar phosphate permease [Streptomyces sp. 2112.2]